MAQVVKSNMHQRTCVGLYREAIGFQDQDTQFAKLNEFASQNNLILKEKINLNNFKTKTVADLVKRIMDSGAHEVAIWRLDCFTSPVVHLDDFIFIVAELSRSEITFSSIENGLNTSDTAIGFFGKLDIAWESVRQNRKIENAKFSVFKTRSRNNKAGRRLLRNDGLIRKLREEGLTIRQIAVRIGLSTAAVQRGLSGKLKAPQSSDLPQTEV